MLRSAVGVGFIMGGIGVEKEVQNVDLIYCIDGLGSYGYVLGMDRLDWSRCLKIL